MFVKYAFVSFSACRTACVLLNYPIQFVISSDAPVGRV